jgi:chemotaxis protein histidine kinase CheA
MGRRINMRIKTQTILKVLLSLTLILASILTPALADTGLDGWLDQLPASDAQTACAIAEHLNNQWAVIRRDETARGVLEYETGALEKARSVMATQDASRTSADAALADAMSAASDAESMLADLKNMRDIQNVYEAAQRAYSMAVKNQEDADAALTKAEDELNAAQSIAEETNHTYAEQAEAFELAAARIQTLRDQVAKMANSPDADAIKTAEADLAAAELTHAAFAKQLAQYAEQAARGKDTAAEAETKYNKALEASRAALDNVETTQAALTEAQTALDALQLTYAELDAFEEEARLSVLRTKAALDAAKTLADQAVEDLNKRSVELSEAESRFSAASDEADEAAEALAALRSKWLQYSACIGAVLDTYPMPAMDLLAQAESAPELYAVYLNGTRLYLFRPSAGEAVREPFLSAVLKENKTTVELTRNGKGIMSLRYVSTDGKTHLQSLGADASALMTGVYASLIIDSQLRGMTQYLGEAASVNTTSMHGLTTLVQFGADNPIRHEPRPQ